MKIGIHHSKGSYSSEWISYCKKNNIPYKVVNSYSSDIIKTLEDCDIFMWHHNQNNPKDILFAKQLLFALEQSGKIVYPDWKTGWHFDDKLGQKYLLEALNLPLVPSYVFYSITDALEWASNYQFPAVFKLRCGAGSYNVTFVKTKKEAIHLIKKAFAKGLRHVNPIMDINEKIRKISYHKAGFRDLIKSALHLIYPYQIEKVKGREQGYVYFQDFVKGCRFDIRVQLIGDKCYAMTRNVRKNDFRASGSGDIDYDGSKVPVEAIKLTFDVARKLKMQTLAIDLLPKGDSFLIAEISYAFAIDEGELDFGYWDDSLIWHPGPINPFAWMVEDLILIYKNRKNNL